MTNTLKLDINILSTFVPLEFWRESQFYWITDGLNYNDVLIFANLCYSSNLFTFWTSYNFLWTPTLYYVKYQNRPTLQYVCPSCLWAVFGFVAVGCGGFALGEYSGKLSSSIVFLNWNNIFLLVVRMKWWIILYNAMKNNFRWVSSIWSPNMTAFTVEQ